jgi:hypothetical protein
MTVPYKAYVGDGVYAQYDGWDLTLTTENGHAVTNQILLEPEVWKNLQRFISVFGPTRETETAKDGVGT